MFTVVPSPTQQVWLQDERGVVIASGTNIEDLKMNLRVSVERREMYPFDMIRDEFGKKVMLKDWIRR